MAYFYATHSGIPLKRTARRRSVSYSSPDIGGRCSTAAARLGELFFLSK